jgi:hypothetical protein
MGASKSIPASSRNPLSSDELIARFSHITSGRTVEVDVPHSEIPNILKDIRASLLQIDRDLKQLRRREWEQARVIEVNEKEMAERIQGVQGDILKLYRSEYERTQKLIGYMLKVRFVLLSILAKLIVHNKN